MPIQLDIVTPEKRVLSVQVDRVTVPGAEGQFGVLPGHTPFITTMEPGELVYARDGVDQCLFVAGGFVEVADDRVIVLAEAAERCEEIDIARAEKALSSAEQRLRDLHLEEEAARVERARVRRATARIALGRRR